MKGSIFRRSKGSWTIVLDLGYVEEVDPKTGERRRRRKQKWVTFHGTKKQAQARLTELLNEVNRGQFVAPSRLSFGEWLDIWLTGAIKSRRRESTYVSYEGIIRNHLKPALGAIRLQDLRAFHLQEYYANSSLAGKTLEKHHMVIHAALKAAKQQRLIEHNEAELVMGKPHGREGHEDVMRNCWEAEEAQRFLKAAKAFGPQAAAFYALALDTGMRKSELCGLAWADVDLENGEVRVFRQLTKRGSNPTFGPVKNGLPRTVSIAPETVALLRRHKAHQAEVKMANRTVYNDLGLCFAKEWAHLTRGKHHLGDPLQANNIGEREFRRIIKAAGVRRIVFHGLRHTSATLLLKTGVPPTVVAARLGHKRTSTLLDVYAHALPSMQADAAERLATALYGANGLLTDLLAKPDIRATGADGRSPKQQLQPI